MKRVERPDLLQQLRRLGPSLRDEGVASLALFGSRARGDGRADSDIDLLINFDDRRRYSLLDVIGIAHLVEDNLGLEANVFDKRSLDSEFMASVKRDLVEVY